MLVPGTMAEYQGLPQENPQPNVPPPGATAMNDTPPKQLHPGVEKVAIGAPSRYAVFVPVAVWSAATTVAPSNDAAIAAVSLNGQLVVMVPSCQRIVWTAPSCPKRTASPSALKP